MGKCLPRQEWKGSQSSHFAYEGSEEWSVCLFSYPESFPNLQERGCSFDVMQVRELFCYVLETRDKHLEG